MNDKEKEKRITYLRETIALQNLIMEAISRKRGEHFLELCKLEMEQIDAEAQLEPLTVGP